MDPEMALLLLDTGLETEMSGISVDLNQLKQAVIAAAGIPGGYTGAAWIGGAKVLQIASNRFAESPQQAFDSFGWSALAAGIGQALQDRQVLAALSYASVPFLPPDKAPSVFEHWRIAAAIRSALKKTPQPFIKPADLGVAPSEVQEQFGHMLRSISKLHEDKELCLQWAAAALRVVPVDSNSHVIASQLLLQTLQEQGRATAAYYAFRALTENHEELWFDPVALDIMPAFVEACLSTQNQGMAALIQLCSDDDVVRKCVANRELMLLVGALAVHITRMQHGGQVEATAWYFVNDLYGDSPMLAHVFEEYLVNGSLPELPESKSDRYNELRVKLERAVDAVESELRPRKYKRLASNIHQSILDGDLLPLLEDLHSPNPRPGLLDRISQLDPRELVVESEWQQVSRHQTGTQVNRKMISDLQRALNALEIAAKIRLELDELTEQMTNRSKGEFDAFLEFGKLQEETGSIGRWVFETLLPDLGNQLRAGYVVATKELKVSTYAKR